MRRRILLVGTTAAALSPAMVRAQIALPLIGFLNAFDDLAAIPVEVVFCSAAEALLASST
jgi:hypothetical protein